MPDFDLSVTICSWNTLEDLRACLKSLEAERDSASFEVVVVDNNSEDGSAEMVREEFPWVVLHAMDRNLGFTGGQNLAMRSRRGRHAFLLNSDAVVHPGAIREMLDYIADKPEIGVLGPKVLNPDGSLQFSCRKFPNPVAALFRNTPLGRLFPNNRFTRDYLMADWHHDSPRKVDWVSGCAMLATESFMEKVGLFDEAYYMFCEDVDWCWRAWEAGFQVVYYPIPVVTHAIGRSTDKAPNRMIGRFHRSMLRFYTKNVLPRRPVWARPVLWGFAATALALRAGLFIAKNKVDIVRRRLGR